MRRLYAIYDNKANEVVGPVMVYPNDTVAVRGFGVHASHPESDIHKYPEDFELRYIGNIDQHSGQINPESVETLLTARQWLNAQGDNQQLRAL